MLAYNYSDQRWVDGREGAAERLAQLRQTLEILSGPRAEEYLAFVQKRDEPRLTVAEATAATRRAIADCELELGSS